ncbi:MAG: hypothetical protein CMN76_12350 [Spirochaetaceae bacterium]|nr:hypothetical protein [Spirochaetaceae bacterium]|tara:strand:+ start:36403 stop:36708 length:306 start_codon:yes stop_codon:yes gene_type:complete
MEHVETFVYNLASGRTLEDLKAAVERTQGEFLSGCNGFLERRLIQLKPDQFLEMNRWASEADFQKAMSEAQQHEAVALLMSVIDMDSLTPYHGDLLISYAN